MTLAYSIIASLVIGFVLGRLQRTAREKSLQNRGEALVARVVGEQFGPPDYHLLNHVTLRLEDGTTEIDHILISRFGVFVIETKDYSGWIFADATQAKWTQVLFKAKFRFQNPLLQNARHVRAVQRLLDFVPPDSIMSAVVFCGKAEFKTSIPAGVYGPDSLVEFIRSQGSAVLSVNHVQFAVGRLETARLAISGQTEVEHIQSLERRHGGRTR